MILLEKPRKEAEDPTIADRLIIGPHATDGAVETADHAGQEVQPLQEGEFVIIKDDPRATTWYCAEIRKILADRIEAAQLLYHNHTRATRLSRILSRRKERKVGRSQLP